MVTRKNIAIGGAPWTWTKGKEEHIGSSTHSFHYRYRNKCYPGPTQRNPERLAPERPLEAEKPATTQPTVVCLVDRAHLAAAPQERYIIRISTERNPEA